MPGVVISTQATGASTSALRSASGQLFVVGQSERGSTEEAVLVRGLADFEALFGSRTTYSTLYDTLKTFFEEGGRQAYVARVVGPAAAPGSVVVKDTADVDTVRFNAQAAGAFSSGLMVRVEAGSVSNTKKVTIFYGGTAVASHGNLDSVAALVRVLRQSPYLRAIDLGSTNAGFSGMPKNGEYTLTAGSDDRNAITATHYVAALARFVKGLGDGSVAIPGVGTTVHEGLIDHAEANSRVALLSMDVDDSMNDAALAALSLTSDSAGLFMPWLQVSDNASGTRNVPPEGYVAGVRARAHDQVGPWRAPAGGIAVASSVIGVVDEYTEEQANALDEAKVSVIRRIANTVRLYGWRSLSPDQANFGYLSARDLLNRLVVESQSRLEQYVFSTVDSRGQTLAAIEGELVGILEPIRQAGGLYERIGDDGEQIDEGYLVETGSSVNTIETLAENRIKARVSVRVAPLGAFIELTIVKVGLLGGLGA